MNKKHLKATPISGVKCPKCGHKFTHLVAECPECHTPIFACNRFGESGQYFEYGRYKQGENGEILPIRWRVVKRFDFGYYMVSERVLMRLPTRKGYDPACTWESSDLRKWLNGQFYREVFSDSEKEAILPVENNDDPVDPTVDCVFVPSLGEMCFARTAFGNRVGFPSAYCAKIFRNFNCDETDELTPVPWWLRSGFRNGNVFNLCDNDVYFDKNKMANMKPKGDIGYWRKPGSIRLDTGLYGSQRANQWIGVRVAIWLDAKKAGLVDCYDYEFGLSDLTPCLCPDKYCHEVNFVDTRGNSLVRCRHCGREYAAATWVKTTERNYLPKWLRGLGYEAALKDCLRDYHPVWLGHNSSGTDSLLYKNLPPCSVQPNGEISIVELESYARAMTQTTPGTHAGISHNCLECGGKIVLHNGKEVCSLCGAPYQWKPTPMPSHPSKTDDQKADEMMNRLALYEDSLNCSGLKEDNVKAMDRLLYQWQRDYLDQTDPTTWKLRNAFRQLPEYDYFGSP